MKPTLLAVVAGICLLGAGCQAQTALHGTLPTDDLLIVDDTGRSDMDASVIDKTFVQGSSTLSEEEIAGLKYMREEEKLAHDVYQALGEEFGLQIFSNISQSEQTHTNSVLSLLEKYNIDDPAKGNAAGEFNDPVLQDLYNTLVAKGKASVEAALMVGANIEELDIQDIQIRIDQTDEPAIKTVYENLMRGSRNHLRAFTRQLSQQTGAAYESSYLPQDEVDAITTSDTERGSGSRGSGGGNGRQGNRK